MADLEIKKPAQALAPRTTDVFDAMRREMDRVFDQFETGWPRWPTAFMGGADRDMLVPDIDVRESAKEITIDMELPGVSEKDCTVTMSDGVLTIKGTKESSRKESKDNAVLEERSYGSFERSLRLPDSIDEGKVEAHFKNGVLTVVVPKRPEAVKAEKKIEIKKA